MSAQDGGPAFPWGGEVRGGMTLRDWFAGQAMAGLCSLDGVPPVTDADAAVEAYSKADAMLRARDDSSGGQGEEKADPWATVQAAYHALSDLLRAPETRLLPEHMADARDTMRSCVDALGVVDDEEEIKAQCLPGQGTYRSRAWDESAAELARCAQGLILGAEMALEQREDGNWLPEDLAGPLLSCSSALSAFVEQQR